MRRSRNGRVTASVAAAASVLALGCAFAAPATATAATAKQTWHVEYRQAGANIQELVAAGPRSAWAIGTLDRHRLSGLLLHWNGASWRTMSFPGERSYLPDSIYALSATDFWIFGQGTTPNPVALHWRNGAWSNLVLPADAAPMAVISDNNIWVSLGGYSGVGCPHGNNQCSATAHWNGVSWTTHGLAAAELNASASSASNVWTVGSTYLREKPDGHGGFTDSFVPAVFRWNGKAWQRSGLAGARTGITPSIVARSSHDVFVGANTKAHPRACAMRWDGSHWRPFYLPGNRGACGWLSTDDRGGLWFAGQVPEPGFAFTHWWHGHFATTPPFVPNESGWNTNGFWLAAIPHSTSAWVYGSWCKPTLPCRIQGVIAALR